MKIVRKYGVCLVKEDSKKYDIIDKKADSSTKVQELLKTLVDHQSWHNEKFGMLCLDSQNNVVGMHIMFEGTINETNIYPREVAVRALLNNADAIILFHNHPGGSTKASSADINATKSIKSALEVLQIKVKDHIILAGDNSYSFAESGLI